MGYVKLKDNQGGSYLVSAENIAGVKIDGSDRLEINYTGDAQTLVTGVSAYVYADLTTFQAAVEVINGASGPSNMTTLSSLVSSIAVATD